MKNFENTISVQLLHVIRIKMLKKKFKTDVLSPRICTEHVLSWQKIVPKTYFSEKMKSYNIIVVSKL